MKGKQMTAFPIYYHPTTLVFLDDNEHFLNSILLRLDDQHTAKAFTDPTQFFNYIKNHIPPSSFTKECMAVLRDKESDNEIEYGDVERSTVKIDIANIHKKVYDDNRFNENYVVIVDYAMPQMNGLEVSQELRDLPIQFVLLTGQAKPEITIQGFNLGLIQQFIEKGNNINQQLEQAIKDLQKKHFAKESEAVFHTLAASPISCLGEPRFIEFFQNLIKEKEIVEYYLVNESGCFVMFDAAGNSSWLIVKNDIELNDYVNTAEANLAPDNILQPLKNREKILFLFTKEDEEHITVDQWAPYLHNATALEGEKRIYYYAYLHTPCQKAVYDRHLKPIRTYDMFLSNT